ncbi:MAG: efflux RND transporter periplasmic adaptor subunit [Pseudomonadota bacterium]
MAKKPLSIWYQLFICLCIGAVVFVAWQQQESVRSWFGVAAQDNGSGNGRGVGAPVIVAPVRQEADFLVFETVGTGVAQQSVLLRAEADGRVIDSSLVADGQFNKGDVLLRLDDSEQQLALRLAETRLVDAERNRNRLEQLRQSDAVSASAHEDTITAVELASLELQRAEEAILDRVVIAPFDGVSGLPTVERGDWVEAGDQLATFDDRRSILVEFDLPETILARLDQKSRLRAASFVAPDRVYEGTIVSIDSRIDPATRAAKVRVSIENTDDLLRPGASFTLALELQGRTLPVVPELALQFTSASLYVWRINDGMAERVDVKLVRRRSGEVLVDGQLSEGDRVVIEGTQRLTPGRAVNVIGNSALEAAPAEGSQVES